MITEDQYLEALRVVRAYEDERYYRELVRAREAFPRGCRVVSRSGWSSGTVYGYGRQRGEVTLRFQGSHSASFCLAKYAKKGE